MKKAEKNINLNFLIMPKSIYLLINFLFFLYLNYLNKNPYQQLLRKVVLKVYDLTNLVIRMDSNSSDCINQQKI